MQREHIHYRAQERDPLELFHIVLKRWRIVLCCIFMGLIIGAVYCLFAPRKYESKALLHLKQQNFGLTNTASPVVFATQKGSMTEQQVMGYTQLLTSEEAVASILTYVNALSPKLYQEILPNCVDFIKHNVRFEYIYQTDFVRFITSAQTPQLAQQLNNCLLKTLQQILFKLNNLERHSATEFLEKRLQSAKVALDRAEDDLREFLVINKSFTPEQHSGFLDQRFATLNNYLAENEIAEGTTLNKLEAVKSQLKAAGVLNVATNNMTDSIQKSITELEIERISYIGNYTEEHPRIKEIQKQIAALKKRLKVEIDNIVKLKTPSENPIYTTLVSEMLHAKIDLAIIRNKKQVLAKLYEQNDKELKALPKVSQEYARLERQCSIATELYTLLAKKLEESHIAEAMETDNIQIVYHGNLPRKPSTVPQKIKILFTFALLGGLLAIGFILLQLALHPTIITENDITRILGLPVLVSICEKKSFTDSQNNTRKKHRFKVFDWKRN